MAFAGYLFSVRKISGGVTTWTPFPNKYIKFDTYKTTPNQREEIRAYRDDNTRDLTRITASGKKSIFSFDVRENLHLADIITILTFFKERYTNEEQRQIYAKFWNNETLTTGTSGYELGYTEGYFYIPNIEYPIKKITSSDILYNTFKLSFIQY